MKKILIAFIFATSVNIACSQSTVLSSINLDPTYVKIEDANFKGKKAVRVFGMNAGDNETIATLKQLNFENGTIEIDVAGQVLPNSSGGARGFIGIAFRMRTTDSIRYECFYIRPTNGRAEDQLRRNHSTQYISHPKYTWFKLRDENPGVYESYADIIEGEWTKLKIEVKDNKARLYVNGATQPSLIVNDLKYGKSNGAIALWVGPGTDGYFANLNIKPN
jgi:hypothetical protein